MPHTDFLCHACEESNAAIAHRRLAAEYAVTLGYVDSSINRWYNKARWDHV